jgi:hypothetical protein
VYLLNLPQVPVISPFGNASMTLHDQLRIQDLAVPLIVWFAVQGAPPLIFEKQRFPIDLP